MKKVVIKNTWLEESKNRLDASFHLSDGVNTKRIIEKYCPYKLKSLKSSSEELFKGNIHKRVYVDSIENGHPFYTASDLFKTELKSNKYISKKYSPYLKELELKKDWILVTRSGTLGKVVYTTSDNENSIGTDDLVRIKPKNKEIKSGYLYAFLTSKFGYGLLTQSGYGGVVKHIEPHHVENILIPVFPSSKQLKISDLIINSVNLRTGAIGQLNKAVKYFENKIGVSNVHLDYQTTSIKAGSINDFPKRLDAQYQILWKALKKENNSQLEFKKISSFAKAIFVGGRGKRIYVANGIPFLSSSEMMLFNPKRTCKKVSKRTIGLGSMIVSQNDILISRSGTVGNTVLVGDQLDNTAISEHALRLIIDPKKISPNYVFCFLKTKYGMKSMEASSFGSVIITLNEELIGNIDIPILHKEDQGEISELIENYITKMDKSVALENDAIDLVEKEIEQWQK